jgi:hypothetical protein
MFEYISYAEVLAQVRSIMSKGGDPMPYLNLFKFDNTGALPRKPSTY